MLLTDHLVPVRLWTAAALGSGGTLTSDPVLVTRFKRLESLMFLLSVSSGNPDIKIEWAIGTPEGVFGSYAELLASSATTYSGSPSGENLLALPAPLGAQIKFKLTDLASKATTTTAILMARE